MTVRCRVRVLRAAGARVEVEVLLQDKGRTVRTRCTLADLSGGLPRLPPAGKVRREQTRVRVGGRSLPARLESWRVNSPTGMVRVTRWLCPAVPFGLARLEMGAFSLAAVAFGTGGKAGKEPSFPFSTDTGAAPANDGGGKERRRRSQKSSDNKAARHMLRRRLAGDTT